MFWMNMGEMAHRQNKTTKMLKLGAKRLRNTETNILKKKTNPNKPGTLEG